jgi:integrase
LLLGAAPEILPYYAIALFAGLRRSEICRLSWDNIKWAKGIIELRGRNTKVGQSRYPVLCEALLAFLEPYKGSSGWIVPRNRVRELMEETREAAGITEWPANALRHSFCSYYVALHQDAAKTAFAAGHSTTKTTYDHYLHLVEEDAAKKYFAIRPAAPTNVIAMGSAAA